MLCRAGDGAGDVQLGADDLAGQSYLQLRGHPALVHRGARGADGAAERLGARFQDGVEVVRPFQTAAAGDDDIGVFQPHAFGFGLDALHHGHRQRSGVHRHVNGNDLALPPGVRFGGRHRFGSHRGHLRACLLDHHGRHGVAAGNRAGRLQQAGLGVDGQIDAIRGQSGAQPEPQPRAEVAAVVAHPHQQNFRLRLFGDLCQHRAIRCRLVGLQHVGVRHVNVVSAVRDGFLGRIADTAAEHRGNQRLTERVSQATTDAAHLLGNRCQRGTGGFCENQYPLGHASILRRSIL